MTYSKDIIGLKCNCHLTEVIVERQRDEDGDEADEFFYATDQGLQRRVLPTTTSVDTPTSLRIKVAGCHFTVKPHARVDSTSSSALCGCDSGSERREPKPAARRLAMDERASDGALDASATFFTTPASLFLL